MEVARKESPKPLNPDGFGFGVGVAVGEEGVADGVEAMVVELYGVVEDAAVFILRI